MTSLLLQALLFSADGYAIPVSLLGEGDLVITEIMHTPIGVADYRGEWIEIYNNSGSDVELDTLELTDGTQTTTISSASLSVANGEFVLLATRSNTTTNGGVLGVNYVYNVNELRLSGGEQLSLVAGTTTIDTFDWDYGGNYPEAYGESLSLNPNATNSSDNDLAANWCLASTSYGLVGNYGTPGEVNDSCQSSISSLGVGDLIITEVMTNPTKVVYYRGEWIEIYNNSNLYVDLNGLEVTDSGTDSFTISGSTLIKPGEYILLANRYNPFYNGGLPTVDYAFSYGSMRLNSNDDISISFSGTVFDTFAWTSSYITASGTAVSLAPEAYDATQNDTESSWCGASSTYGDGDFGTPRALNDACSSFDGDGDGYTTNGGDCDDSDGSVNPDADEVCDGIDNNCSGDIDDNAIDGTTYYADGDSDTYGDPNTSVVECLAPSGYVTDNTDCDDLRSTVNPGADEVCDGINNDCDIDGIDEDGAVDGISYFVDSDLDTYGDPTTEVISCSQPSGFVDLTGDCDDADPNVYPAAPEDCSAVSDLNCDGQIGAGDSDGDGFSACSECDDGDANVNPNATEVCDGVDNDCDGVVDGAGAVDAQTWYLDSDTDSFGDINTTQVACSRPTNYLADFSDCDDLDSDQFPGAPEFCNSEDDDCDNEVDEAGAVDGTTYYADSDSDTFGDPSNTTTACSSPSGYVSDNTDCNDGDSAINTDATEVCDSIDNDCDTLIDDDDSSIDASTGTEYYFDGDFDLFGDPNNSIFACSLPSGYRTNNTDCDDTNGLIRPVAQEVCDTIDNDCDTLIDDADDSLGGALSTYYADNDSDNFGDPNSMVNTCSPSSGFVTDNTDCDDSNSAVNPDETETCDGVDNNCSGDEADAPGSIPYYADTDGDTYGDNDSIFNSCVQPSGYVSDNTDCDDTSSAVNPGVALELCDSIDNDCDSLIDDDDSNLDPSSTVTYYNDVDLDFYGSDNDTIDACNRPSGYRTTGGDCEDNDIAINPGALEVCDTIDNDCDTLVDADDPDVDPSGTGGTFYADTDNDSFGDPNNSQVACSQPSGYLTDNTDCNDSELSINPNALEVCDTIDNDCDTLVDGDDPSVDLSTGATYFADSDGDTFGDANTTQSACSQPAGYTTDNTDCNDGEVTINPGATEECLDGIDSDCDNSDNLSVCETDASNADQAFYGNTGFKSGYSLSSVGDFNNDGNADFMTSSRGDKDGGGSGAAYVFFGPLSGSETIATADMIVRGVTGDAVGVSVSGGSTAPSNDSGYHAINGDVNGDGFDDILLGAPYNDNAANNAGMTYLVYGNNSGGTISASSADASFSGEGVDDQSGSAVSILGDINGDNIADIAIGAGRNDENDFDSGRVYIFYGSSSSPLSGAQSVTTADVIIDSDRTRDFLGYSVGAVGDVDGDGSDDIMASAYRRDRYTSANHPNACDPLEDIGCIANEGEVFIWSGGSYAAAESVNTADTSFVGENDIDQIGVEVRSAGDIDNDGRPDLAISASYYSGLSLQGAFYITKGNIAGRHILDVSNSAVIAKFVGNTVGDQYGKSGQGLGDIDGDGHDDVIIGARRVDVGGSDAGAAYIYMGPLSGTYAGTDADVIIDGENAGDNLGVSVSPAGDIDNDGTMDILIGADFDVPSASDAGATYLIYGSSF